MARMHSRKRGKHKSKKPPVKIVPRWLKIKKEEAEGLVVKLAKEKNSSAVIGQILRDQYGIPDIKAVTGKSVVQIMRENKVYPEIPEDMLSLLKRVVNLMEHVERNKADASSRKGLENLESKIRRLGKYYVRKGLLPKDWSYDRDKARLIVQK